MNKKNCPNAFDSEYLDNLSSFVDKYKSILFLVWFRHLDEAYALEFFHGHVGLRQLLSECEYYISEEINSLEKLHGCCKASSFYKF